MGRNEDILRNYSGATVLNFLCDYTSLSIDQVNFICCQLFALLLSCILKIWIRNPLTRLWYCFVCGIGMCVFCFGTQTFHIIISGGLSYLVICNTKSRFMPWIVFVVSMVYLSLNHLKRQFYDHSAYALDITGPLMVLTQKVTSLAFSIRDGVEQNTEGFNTKDATELQKRYSVSSIPDSLTYCSFVFQFQSMLAGPLVLYRDFLEFIETEECPNPLGNVLKKLSLSIFIGSVFLKFGNLFQLDYLREVEFLDETSFIYKLYYITFATTLERFKYYHAWILADAVCNASGLGYDRGKGNWDLVSNVHAVSFELGTNMKESLDCWNMGTMKWLRHVIYERASPNTRTGLVYVVSAFWHGFYPGYYITFISGALFTFSARTLRRNIRPFFLHSGLILKGLYDFVTWFTTRLVIAYVTFSFVVQDFLPSLEIFIRLYFFIHAAAIISLPLAPIVAKNFGRRDSVQQVKLKDDARHTKSDAALLSPIVRASIVNGQTPVTKNLTREASLTEAITNEKSTITEEKVKLRSYSKSSPEINPKESFQDNINEDWKNMFISHLNGSIKLKTG